ncbi:phytanoyl-CoA dioxygenase family protein [Pseudomonas sp. B26(2017)]|uniref:phytanoyl-CoA dioxygenase family protein n=1 Tax=Pseudomonas sp. B26(2017) TaxID=1981732 RepID=UPI000A1EE3AA|nr:phytanoyl-CoA dioxygenase family protein [Pseudomonas sp. B26(2017)]
MADREQLHRNGYVLLRQAIAPTWLDTLRAVFDAGVKPSGEWPVPRGIDWRHSQLDTDATVQAVCRLPPLLAVVGELIGERFFLSQVEGREPLIHGGHQQLHRDLSAQRPGDTVNALVYLDAYGPENGATRIVPGSHRSAMSDLPFNFTDESRSVQLTGSAGDILIFDADLIHAGSLNASGARRRTLLITFFSESLYATHLETVNLRNIRMDTSERLDPTDFAFAIAGSFI